MQHIPALRQFCNTHNLLTDEVIADILLRRASSFLEEGSVSESNALISGANLSDHSLLEIRYASVVRRDPSEFVDMFQTAVKQGYFPSVKCLETIFAALVDQKAWPTIALTVNTLDEEDMRLQQERDCKLNRNIALTFQMPSSKCCVHVPTQWHPCST